MNQYYSHFHSAKALTDLLENKFRIGNKRFGLDPILGLFPYFGDLVSLMISLYIIWIAVQAKVPADKIAAMIGNVVYDFLIGLVPVLGDLADFGFKANTRNIRILEEFMLNYSEAKVVGV